MVRGFKKSVKDFSVKLGLPELGNYRVPCCLYDLCPCTFFDSIVGRSECCIWSSVVSEYFRCSRLPLWVLSGNHFAVYSGGRLHV